MGSAFISCSSSNIENDEIDEKYNDLLKRTHAGALFINSSKVNENAAELVVQGSLLQQKKKYAEAILEFQEALKIDTSASIYYAIAYNYKELAKYGPAIDNILKALELKPEFIPAIELLAEIYRMFGKHKEAVSAYEKIFMLEPNNNNKLQLALALELTDKQKALKLLEELRNDNEGQLILTHLLILYEEMNKEDEYINTIESLYNYSPGNIRLSLLIFESYHKKKLYSHLQEFLNKIESNLDVEDFEICINYSGSQILNDNSKESKEYAASLVAKIDNRFRFDPQINLLAGRISNKIGDTLIADKHFDLALKLSDTLSDAPIVIAYNYWDNERHYKAIETALRYEKDFPTDNRFPLTLALWYSNISEYRKALEQILIAKNIDSSSFDVWAQAGIIYDQLGNRDSSDISYSKALEINPDDPLVNNNYAYSLSERNIELAKALGMVNKALLADPKNPSYLDTYGWIQYRMGDYEKALKYVLDAVKHGDGGSEVQEHLGDIYIELRRKEKAIEAWKKAIEIEPGRESTLKRLREIK